MIFGAVNQRGKGLTLTLHSVGKALLRKNSELPSDFVRDISPERAPIRSTNTQTTRHADHYQYDKETNTLLFNGRMLSADKPIENLPKKLVALAGHIVENMTEMLHDTDLPGHVNYAVFHKKATTAELERVILSLHNALWTVSCVQTLFVAFEMLLRQHIKTRISVVLRSHAGTYHAFINGNDLSPKKALRKLYRQVRTMQADILGVKLDDDHDSKTDY